MPDHKKVQSMACSTHIDERRITTWGEGFQVYFVFQEWIAGAQIIASMGPSVTGLNRCWGLAQSCADLESSRFPACDDKVGREVGFQLTRFKDGELSFFLGQERQVEVGCVFDGSPPLPPHLATHITVEGAHLEMCA